MSNEQLVNVLIAYSYIRFSTKGQANRHSLQRQWEMTAAYCQRRGWTLSTATYQDLGVSARKGKNALVGNLGEFLKAIESGAVKPGSALIVESLDRITRQGIDEGWDLIKKLLKAGVILVTLAPEREYDVRATRSLSQGALEIQFMLEQAAIENEKRAERVQKAWAEKKRRARNRELQLATECMGANAKALTRRLPVWLRWDNGTAVVVEEVAAVVRLMFSLAMDGYGLSAITKKLNADKKLVGRSGIQWPRANVGFILKNRAVLGEYQPHTIRSGKRQPDGEAIPGYYPRIIEDQEWLAVRGAMTTRRNCPGRAPNRGTNVFSGLVYDARDGGKMHVMAEGKRNGPRLTSANNLKGIATHPPMSFPFVVFEKAMFYCLREIGPGDILPAASPQENKTQSLRDQLAGIEVEIDQLKARLQKKYTDAVADVLEKQEDEKKRLKKELEAAMQKAATPLSSAWEQCETLVDVLKVAPNQEDARVRLQAALRRIVSGIYLYVVTKGRSKGCFVEMNFNEGEETRLRGFFIFSEPPLVVGGRKRRGYWMCCSQWSEHDVCDIRKPETQAFVDEFLTKFELPEPEEREETHKLGFHAEFVPVLVWEAPVGRQGRKDYSSRPRPSWRRRS